MNLARAFYRKCVTDGDYIAFILLISQLDNSSSLFEFDLVYSEDLGSQSLQEIVERLDASYRRFFNHTAKRPPKCMIPLRILRSLTSTITE